jgi:DNA-binding NarL/FixJ family response regulator
VSKTDAIRVIVGDGSRVDRDLVRFMLERDGFRVISSVAASEDLSRAAGVMQPDAVVLGEELLDVRGAEAARLVRHACPMAKIVLFSALPAAAAVGPAEPDAVLERGIGLKDLTPALNDLFEPIAGAGVVTMLPTAAATAAATDEPPPARVAAPPSPPRAADSRRRSVAVLTAAAAAMLLLIFAVARTYPSEDSAIRASSPPSTTPGAGVPVAPSGGEGASIGVGATSAPSDAAQSHLSEARSLYEHLQGALRSGSVFEVTRLAREIVAERAVAQAAGANIAPLNEWIQQTLPRLTSGLDPQYASALRIVLGSGLVPPANTGSESPGSETSNAGGAGATGAEQTPPPDTGSSEVPPPTGTGGTGPSGGTGAEDETPSPTPVDDQTNAAVSDSDKRDEELASDGVDQAPGHGADGFSTPPDDPTPSSERGDGSQDPTHSGATHGASPASPTPSSQANAESTPPGDGDQDGVVNDAQSSRPEDDGGAGAGD